MGNCNISRKPLSIREAMAIQRKAKAKSKVNPAKRNQDSAAEFRAGVSEAGKVIADKIIASNSKRALGLKAILGQRVYITGRAVNEKVKGEWSNLKRSDMRQIHTVANILSRIMVHNDTGTRAILTGTTPGVELAMAQQMKSINASPGIIGMVDGKVAQPMTFKRDRRTGESYRVPGIDPFTGRAHTGKTTKNQTQTHEFRHGEKNRRKQNHATAMKTSDVMVIITDSESGYKSDQVLDAIMVATKSGKPFIVIDPSMNIIHSGNGYEFADTNLLEDKTREMLDDANLELDSKDPLSERYPMEEDLSGYELMDGPHTMEHRDDGEAKEEQERRDKDYADMAQDSRAKALIDGLKRLRIKVTSIKGEASAEGLYDMPGKAGGKKRTRLETREIVKASVQETIDSAPTTFPKILRVGYTSAFWKYFDLHVRSLKGTERMNMGDVVAQVFIAKYNYEMQGGSIINKLARDGLKGKALTDAVKALRAKGTIRHPAKVPKVWSYLIQDLPGRQGWSGAKPIPIARPLMIKLRELREASGQAVAKEPTDAELAGMNKAQLEVAKNRAIQRDIADAELAMSKVLPIIYSAIHRGRNIMKDRGPVELNPIIKNTGVTSYEGAPTKSWADPLLALREAGMVDELMTTEEIEQVLNEFLQMDTQYSWLADTLLKGEGFWQDFNVEARMLDGELQFHLPRVLAFGMDDSLYIDDNLVEDVIYSIKGIEKAPSSKEANSEVKKIDDKAETSDVPEVIEEQIKATNEREGLNFNENFLSYLHGMDLAMLKKILSYKWDISKDNQARDTSGSLDRSVMTGMNKEEKQDLAERTSRNRLFEDRIDQLLNNIFPYITAEHANLIEAGKLEDFINEQLTRQEGGLLLTPALEFFRHQMIAGSDMFVAKSSGHIGWALGVVEEGTGRILQISGEDVSVTGAVLQGDLKGSNGVLPGVTPDQIDRGHLVVLEQTSAMESDVRGHNIPNSSTLVYHPTHIPTPNQDGSVDMKPNHVIGGSRLEGGFNAGEYSGPIEQLRGELESVLSAETEAIEGDTRSEIEDAMEYDDGGSPTDNTKALSKALGTPEVGNILTAQQAQKLLGKMPQILNTFRRRTIDTINNTTREQRDEFYESTVAMITEIIYISRYGPPKPGTAMEIDAMEYASITRSVDQMLEEFIESKLDPGKADVLFAEKFTMNDVVEVSGSNPMFEQIELADISVTELKSRMNAVNASIAEQNKWLEMRKQAVAARNKSKSSTVAMEHSGKSMQSSSTTETGTFTSRGELKEITYRTISYALIDKINSKEQSAVTEIKCKGV